MKKFLAVYTGTPEHTEASGWDDLSEDGRRSRVKAGIVAWEKWMEANQEHIVETGAPVGQAKRISPQGITDGKNNVCGYIIIEAESREAAAQLFEGHPHFTSFPGDAVEVMECLPLPPAPD